MQAFKVISTTEHNTLFHHNDIDQNPENVQPGGTENKDFKRAYARQYKPNACCPKRRSQGPLPRKNMTLLRAAEKKQERASYARQCKKRARQVTLKVGMGVDYKF